MAKANFKCSLTKGAAPAKMAAAGAKATGTEILIHDDGKLKATVYGVDAAGAQVPLDGIAALTVTSDDTSFITVDPPTKASFVYHGVKPTTSPVNLNLTVTMNDGATGPFSMKIPATVTAGPVVGLAVDLGQPVPA